MAEDEVGFRKLTFEVAGVTCQRCKLNVEVVIQRINQRGSELQKLRADSVRANYGLGPVDAAEYERQPAALGGGARPGNRPPLADIFK